MPDYPILVARGLALGIRNIDLILTGIKENFSDLFDLDILEEEVKVGRASNYRRLFEVTIQEVNTGLALVPELSEVLCKLTDLCLARHEVTKEMLGEGLGRAEGDDAAIEAKFSAEIRQTRELMTQQPTLSAMVGTQYFYVPFDSHSRVAPQKALIEKLATGIAAREEELTFIDMWRASLWMEIHTHKIIARDRHLAACPNAMPHFGVIHINNLEYASAGMLEDRILFVNVAQTGMAKWCVVDLRKKIHLPSKGFAGKKIQYCEQPTVFCDACLTPGEQALLDHALRKIWKLPNEYLGGGSSFSVATGYRALAFVNTVVRRAGPMELHGDLNALTESFLYLMKLCLGGAPTESVSVLLNGDNLIPQVAPEDERYMSESCQIISRQRGNAAPADFFYQLAGAVLLGQAKIDDVRAVPANLCQALDLLAKERPASYWREEWFQMARHINKRSLIIGFNVITEEYSTFSQTTDSLFLGIYYGALKVKTGFQETYKTMAEAYALPPRLFRQSLFPTILLTSGLDDDPDKAEAQKKHSVAFSFLSSVIRGFARKPVLQINFDPAFQLTLAEQSVINRLLRHQAYICKLELNGEFLLKDPHLPLSPNASLLAVRETAMPVLARNEFLRKHGYLPSIAGDHWQAAAEYWLACVCDDSDILSGHTEDSRSFKEATYDMGIEILEAVLDLLINPRYRKLVERIAARRTLPVFYFNCVNPIFVFLGVERLVHHLKECQPFPFAELQVQCPMEDYMDSCMALLSEANRCERLERIVLLGDVSVEFIRSLLDVAIREQWTTPLMVASLTETDPLCTQLNNIILHNKRTKKASVQLARIRATSSAYVLPQSASEVISSGVEESKGEESFSSLHVAAEAMLKNIPSDASWPLKREGGVQLQQQQQQQQQQQISQDTMILDESSKTLPYQLVSYDNIEALLKPYAEQRKLYSRPGSLKSFFKQVISANAMAHVPHVIRYMTFEAAQYLLTVKRLLTAGLNPENLPKGFYIVPNKEGDWVLCYKPNAGYVSVPTPLTVELDVPLPQAKPWQGDHQQFALSAYAKGEVTLEEKAEHQQLFAMLQSESSVATLSQMRVVELLQIDNKLTPFVFHCLETKALTLCALGQVYYDYGTEGINVLFAQLLKMQQSLPDAFAKMIVPLLLISANHNPSVYLSEKFFNATDAMISMLSQQEEYCRLFHTIITKHFKTTQFDLLENVWQGFVYFIKEVENLSLRLRGDEFDKATEQNMLVSMDRVLESLSLMNSRENQHHYLHELREGQIYLEHGSLFYAIKYNGFRRVDANKMCLDAFVECYPTYATDPKSLYTQQDYTLSIQLARLLASHPRFTETEYVYLRQHLDALPKKEMHAYFRDQLIVLLHTQYVTVESALTDLNSFDIATMTTMARALHVAAYGATGNSALSVDLNHFIKFASHPLRDAFLASVFPINKMFELVDIFYKLGREQELPQLLALLQASRVFDALPQDISAGIYCVAAVIKQYDVSEIVRFCESVSQLLPAVHRELRVLLKQMTAIDYSHSQNAAFALSLWSVFVAMVERAEANPVEEAHRIAAQFIEQLTLAGVKFTCSIKALFKRVGLTDMPSGLGGFGEKETRLRTFMFDHLVTKMNASAAQPLISIVKILKQLQTASHDIDEVEVLLSVLEKTPENTVWSADYFYGLLCALLPQDKSATFPSYILTALLSEEYCKAKSMDEVIAYFSSGLSELFQRIVNNPTFGHAEKTALCQLAAREWQWSKNHMLLYAFIEVMATHKVDMLLPVLLQCTNIVSLRQCIEKAASLLQHTCASEYKKCVNIWLMHLDEPGVIDLLDAVMRLSVDKQSLLLHILAHSVVDDQSTSVRHSRLLTRKAGKLLRQLNTLSLEDLQRIAEVYLDALHPNAEQLRRLLKTMARGAALPALIDAFTSHPGTTPRMDYQFLSEARRSDWQRLHEEARIIIGEVNASLSEDQRAQLDAAFTQLKALESGADIGAGKPIHDYTKAELYAAAKDMAQRSLGSPESNEPCVILWALLFEIVARHTHKYPHLAQQFALLANDLFMQHARSTVLLLGTGEGKTLFILLRILRHALQGTVVDVCTAKYSLAYRDFLAAKPLLDDLGISSAYIHENSSYKDYMQTTVHFTILGGLSLRWMHWAFTLQGDDLVQWNHFLLTARRIGLQDEVDHTRFTEGQTTQFNYAQALAVPPKRLMWLYTATNHFYDSYLKPLVEEVAQEDKLSPMITTKILCDFTSHLIAAAGGYEDRQAQLLEIFQEGYEACIQRLNSAVGAATLEKLVHFYVSEEDVEVRHEKYRMQQIVPLSQDAQPMLGSTFSEGVQQLLAMLLISKGQRDVHVPRECALLASMIAAHCMQTFWEKWEGFTGTVSQLQSLVLHQEQGTHILRVPTNYQDLRVFHPIYFCHTSHERMTLFITHIKECLAQNISLLVACSNDKQTMELETALRASLTPAELDHCIFDTTMNLSSADLIKIKRRIEVQGQSSVTVSAKRGRGDDLDVDEVDFLEVVDDNDRRQKGGRTARYGKKGSVRQWCLLSELEKEYLASINFIKKTHAAEWPTIESMLATVGGETEKDRFYHGLLLLREYIAHLKNEANQVYYYRVSEFSSWTMSILLSSSTLATDSREALKTAIAASLKRIASLWINCQSLTTTQEKRAAIERVIHDQAAALSEECAARGSACRSFVMRDYPDVMVKFSVPVAATHAIAIVDEDREAKKIAAFTAKYELFDEIVLKDALVKHKEERWRALGMWEIWACDIADPDGRRLFFLSFHFVMQALPLPEFKLLVNKTHESWQEPDTREVLINLWNSMERGYEALGKLHSQINQLLSIEGKEGMLVLTRLFPKTLSQSRILQKFHPYLYACWLHITNQDLSQKQRITMLDHCIAGIYRYLGEENIYDIAATMSLEQFHAMQLPVCPELYYHILVRQVVKAIEESEIDSCTLLQFSLMSVNTLSKIAFLVFLTKRMPAMLPLLLERDVAELIVREINIYNSFQGVCFILRAVQQISESRTQARESIFSASEWISSLLSSEDANVRELLWKSRQEYQSIVARFHIYLSSHWKTLLRQYHSPFVCMEKLHDCIKGLENISTTMLLSENELQAMQLPIGMSADELSLVYTIICCMPSDLRMSAAMISAFANSRFLSSQQCGYISQLIRKLPQCMAEFLLTALGTSLMSRVFNIERESTILLYALTIVVQQKIETLFENNTAEKGSVRALLLPLLREGALIKRELSGQVCEVGLTVEENARLLEDMHLGYVRLLTEVDDLLAGTEIGRVEWIVKELGAKDLLSESALSAIPPVCHHWSMLCAYFHSVGTEPLKFAFDVWAIECLMNIVGRADWSFAAKSNFFTKPKISAEQIALFQSRTFAAPELQETIAAIYPCAHPSIQWMLNKIVELQAHLVRASEVSTSLRK